MEYGYKVKEIFCWNKRKKIYGAAYIPETEKGGRHPLVIFAHQLGATHAAGAEYAKKLAERGTAVYTFDFCGGGVDSKSDGVTTEMSILTEVEDLEAVLGAARTWDFVDPGKIALLGASQGGVVSAITAARRGDGIAGLILLYPAFMIFDKVHAQFGAYERIPERFCFLDWIHVGRDYAADIWDVDIYSEMEKYSGPVLLIHGGKDNIADISYTRRAAQTFPDARLYMIGRAGHAFFGRSFRESVAYIDDFLKELR